MQKALLVWIVILAGTPLAQAFYNPNAGRWLNRDPIEEKGGTSVYAANNNDLIDLIDINGLLRAFFTVETEIRTQIYGGTQGRKSFHSVEAELDSPRIINRHADIDFTYFIPGSGKLSESLYSYPISNTERSCRYWVYVQMDGDARTRLAPLPNINYDVTFAVEVVRDPVARVKTVKLTGAHDGFPSYIMRYNTYKYDAQEGVIGELLGDSDVDVDVQLYPPFNPWRWSP